MRDARRSPSGGLTPPSGRNGGCLAPLSLSRLGGLPFTAGGRMLGEVLSPLWLIPFAGMLLTIALAPMVAAHWWEHRRNQVLASAFWGAPILVWAGLLLSQTPELGHEALHHIQHAGIEYVSFIALLGSLFIISGGVLLKGDLEARPGVNTAFLAVGALLANLIGTTGASMLLIRPLLRTNRQRQLVRHIPIFFIFVVSNLGGLLTPIGDPPLFLGYLRGVPFFWTVEHLVGEWAVGVGVVLAIFYVIDRTFYGREKALPLNADAAQAAPLGVEGGVNFWLLGGVIAAVILLSPDAENPGWRDYYAREIAMVGLTLLSLKLTPASVRTANAFSYGPITEVAALFAGIFLTMIPATLLLQAQGAALGVTTPAQYFWAAGALSSFLDNAPTYVTFAAMACGATPDCAGADQLGTLAASATGQPLLLAIATGSVFMGANTYIGNGPNFMVRAIAEENGYKMPSFFGYMAWSGAVLLPTFVLITLIFFRG